MTIDDKSPGKMSNKSPQKQPPAKSGKNVTCNVYLLDGENVEITLDKNDVGRALFDQVCTRLDLIEKDYFGLTYTDDRGPSHLKYWLNLDKKISKQKKKGAWVFEFALKFYPPDPTHLRESLTRWLVVLQVRRDLLNGRLPCTFTTYALLGSYNVQADLGEYDPQDHGNSYDYIKDMAFAPNQTPELLEKIADLHKLHKGQTPDEAEKCFLDNAKKLAMYGVDLHKAKDSENQAIMLGVCCSGLLIFRDKLRINRFVWPKILKLSYKRNHFYIKIRPGEMERNDTTMMFKLDNHRLAKRLWKTCVEHHAFFRLREAEKPTNNLTFPRFGSKFRYSGRTLYQSTRSAQLLDRPPPFFERSQPARNSMGDPGNRSRSMDELGRRKDPYDDGMYDPDRSWDEKDKRDIKGVPTAFEKARNSGDARRSGDEDTLQRRPYDSDTADRRDRVPSRGDATMEREKAPGLNESMGVSPGKAETDKERRKREKEEDKRRKEEKKRQEEEEKKKKKKKGGKDLDTSEDRTDTLGPLNAAAGLDDDKDYPYGKDGYDKAGNPFPYIFDKQGRLFPYPKDGHDKDGYRFPYGTAGYDKDGNPNPFVYDKDGNPNPYACDKDGRPNPYVYGKDGKPCPYGKGGFDKEGNPSPYGKDGKDKDGNPFPYNYDKYGNPYPHGKGPHDKEGNRAAHGDDGLDIDGNPFPFIYDKRGEPYPLGKDAHDRDGKTCPYDQDGKDRHGKRFPYIYDKDGKVLPYWKNKIEKDRPDRDGYRNPFGTAGYDRDGRPNPYVYDKEGNPNPYACDRDGNPNPYIFGKDGKPCPYGKGGFDKDGNPSPYGKDGKDKDGNPFPYVYDKFGNPYRQGKGPHDKEGNRAAHGPDGLDKLGSPFPYVYDKHGEPYPHGKEAYDREGNNCPYDQDGKNRNGEWFPYMFDKDGNILPYWQDKLDKDRPDSDGYVNPYGTAGYDKEGNPNPYVYDKDGNPNPYVCDEDGNPNPYVYGKDGKPCPYGKGGFDKEGNPSPYGKDGKDKDGKPNPYIYDKYGNEYPHSKGPHDKEGNRAVHGADGLDREGNPFPFIYDKHGQPYPHGKDAFDKDGNRCPYDRDGKDKHGKPFPYIYDKYGNLLPYCKSEADKDSRSPFSSDWRDKNGHPGPYMYDKDGNLLPYWKDTYDREGYRSPYDTEGKDKDGRPFPYVYDKEGKLLPSWQDNKDGARSPSDDKDKSGRWKAKDDKDKGKKGGLFGRLKKGKQGDDEDEEKWNKDKGKKGGHPDAPDAVRDKQKDDVKEKEDVDEKDRKEGKKDKKGEKEKRHSSNFMASLCVGRSPVKKGKKQRNSVSSSSVSSSSHKAVSGHREESVPPLETPAVASAVTVETQSQGNLGSAPGLPYGVGLGIGKGDMTGVVGEEKSVDKKEIFMPIPKPIRETKESLKSGYSENMMPFFHPAATSTVGRSKVPPPVPPKGNHSLDDSFNPPTVATEKVKYNPHISDVPMSSRNIPLVKTETRTVTYERDNCPSDLDDGMLVSAQSHSSRLQTIETTTYKTEKDGIEQTRVEHRVVMSGDEDDDFDYDSALADAIRSVTEFNPDMSVERIECVQQIEDVKNGN